MMEIERILEVRGEEYLHATNSGARVHPGNAYEADTVEAGEAQVLVLVECEPTHLNGHTVTTLDHHRPGDPGSALPPEQYWKASSLGQLYRLLELGEPDHEHRVLAAIDHSTVAARQGRCPGVSPDEVRAHRVLHVARVNQMSVDSVESAIREFQVKILVAPRLMIGEQQVADLRKIPTGVGYTMAYRCTQESLADLNLVGLIATKNTPHDHGKVVLYGSVTPETVSIFMHEWAPSQGLRNIYGVPTRGYAGGFWE